MVRGLHAGHVENRAVLSAVFLGLALLLGALLWARDIRRKAVGVKPVYRGPWIMGSVGVCIFAVYLWLVTHGVFDG
jgi:hypothetical protein